MRPNFFWKICRIMFTAIIFLSILYKGYGQVTEKIDFTYKVDSVKVSDQYQYIIYVKVTEGKGPFTVSVFENLRDLKILDNKENVSSETTLTITGRKSCIVYVRNSFISAVQTLKYN